MPACLMSNDTEQVQGIRMVGMGLQHASVTSLGRGQAARLVMLKTFLQEIGISRRHDRGPSFHRRTAWYLSKFTGTPPLFAVH